MSGHVQQGFCSSCGAIVVWVVTGKGARMPLDPVPVPNGNVVRTGEQTVRYLKPGEAFAGNRYVSHFSSCPDASSHRRRSS